MSTAQTVTLFPPGRTVACAAMAAVRFAGGGSSKAKSGPQPAKLQWLANTPAPPAQRVRSSAWTARSALRPRRSFKRASQLFQSGHPVVDFLWLQWRPVRLWSRFDVEQTFAPDFCVSLSSLPLLRSLGLRQAASQRTRRPSRRRRPTRPTLERRCHTRPRRDRQRCGAAPGRGRARRRATRPSRSERPDLRSRGRSQDWWGCRERRTSDDRQTAPTLPGIEQRLQGASP
jgi:hypothetical protein